MTITEFAEPTTQYFNPQTGLCEACPSCQINELRIRYIKEWFSSDPHQMFYQKDDLAVRLTNVFDFETNCCSLVFAASSEENVIPLKELLANYRLLTVDANHNHLSK